MEDKPKFAYDYEHISEQYTPSYASDGFFSQEVYLWSDMDLDVTISKEATYFSSNREKNKQVISYIRSTYPEYKEKTDDEILDILDKIKYSLRLSILVPRIDGYKYYIYNPNKQVDKDGNHIETYFVGNLDADTDGFFDYDIYNGNEVLYGEYGSLGNVVYDDPIHEDIPAKGIVTCFNSGHKQYTRSFNLEKSIKKGFNAVKENSISSSTVEDDLIIHLTGSDDPTTSGESEEGKTIPKENKIVVSIYIEGWDKENTNIVRFANFDANIEFKIKGD